MGHLMDSLKHRKGRLRPDALHPLGQLSAARVPLGLSVKRDITLRQITVGDRGCRFRHHPLAHLLHNQ